jgi:uncharacterized protein (TIGR03086 family)
MSGSLAQDACMQTTPQTQHSTDATVPSAAASRPALAPDDPRVVLAKAVALGGTVIGGVGPDRLDDPTPCDDFDVRALLGHLVQVLDRVAAIGNGEEPMNVGVTPGVADDGWAAAWAESAHSVEAAWTDPATLTRTVHLPWATLTGAETLAAYTTEVTLHTWDLAVATGQQPAWDPEVVEVAFASLRRSLPAEGRAERYAEVKATLPPGAWTADPFAPAVEVGPDASPVDRLAAYAGRRP